MTDSTSQPTRATHQVSNQSPRLVDYNVFASQQALVEATEREGAAWAQAGLRAFGEIVGGQEAMDWATAANQFPPILHTHDAYTVCARDRVDFHPAYHQLMALSVRYGLHSMPWREPRAAVPTSRAPRC